MYWQWNDQAMLCSERVAVCFEHNMEHVNVLYGQKDEFSVKPRGKHNNK